MEYDFAKRIQTTQKSFIREIFKALTSPEIISFGGGMPNPLSFPIKEIDAASHKVLMDDGANALQYSNSEGYLPLRQFICDRYLKTKGIKFTPDEVIITTGAQQGFDLIGKAFLDAGDGLAVESPTFLGAIQTFSMYQPEFHSVTLRDDGIDTDELETVLSVKKPKLLYTIPNFNNPTGITYSKEKIHKVADLVRGTNTILIEDDPYSELRFMGEAIPSFKSCDIDDNIILLGTFSKTVSPSMRLGWLCTNKAIMDKIVTAKQASDLHTSYFVQRVVYQFLVDNDFDAHISKTRDLYRTQRQCMVDMIDKYLPKGVTYTKPEGGMFLWLTLPDGMSSLKLFDYAVKRDLAFVPGVPFYATNPVENTLRLNFTMGQPWQIEEGIKRLALAIEDMGGEK